MEHFEHFRPTAEQIKAREEFVKALEKNLEGLRPEQAEAIRIAAKSLDAIGDPVKDAETFFRNETGKGPKRIEWEKAKKSADASQDSINAD